MVVTDTGGAGEVGFWGSANSLSLVAEGAVGIITDGYCRDTAEIYPAIPYFEHIVDNTCMQLVTNPYQYDVMVMENLYGDIISDLCAGFVGGLGLVPGANLGHECAIFEAVHGSAPDIAGKGLANPTAVMQSAVLMLRHIGETNAADRMHAAIEHVYTDGQKTTRDVGGNAGTEEFAL